MSALLEHFDAEDVIREARSRQRLAAGRAVGRHQTFVNVGRLSPEKNHARLIRAFAQVHERHPDVRLVILGGGKLEAELQELVTSLGMESHGDAGRARSTTRTRSWPTRDCFVLSSDYEGQPMVILEARTLGLPVVTTAFSSVGDSVPPRTPASWCRRRCKGVAEGMRAVPRAARCRPRRSTRDAYNRRGDGAVRRRHPRPPLTALTSARAASPRPGPTACPSSHGQNSARNDGARPRRTCPARQHVDHLGGAS